MNLCKLILKTVATETIIKPSINFVSLSYLTGNFLKFVNLSFYM